MSVAAIDYRPIDFDWSTWYPERWDFFEAVRCSTCGKIAVNVRGEEQHNYLDPKSKCTGYVSSDGPMMNYIYPLPREPRDLEKAERAIAHLPLCIVNVPDLDLWGLALSGAAWTCPGRSAKPI